MKFLVILCVVLAPAEFVLVTEPPVADGVKSPNQDKILLPTKKCSDLARDGEKFDDDACSAHCKTLEDKFSEGECVDGVCQCKLDISDIIQSIIVKSRDKGKARGAGGPGKAGRSSRPGVKCKNLIRFGGQAGAENHKGCGVHCRLLTPENKDGRCVDGVCQCSRVASEVKPSPKPGQGEDGKEKEEGGGGSGDVTCSAGNHGACVSQCAGYDDARCVNGTCRCGNAQAYLHQIPDSIRREAKKCEHRRKSMNEEVCRTHCQAFSRDHTEGRCVGGVCQCGYAVFEIEELETEEESTTRESTTKPGRRVRPERTGGRKRS